MVTIYSTILLFSGVHNLNWPRLLAIVTVRAMLKNNLLDILGDSVTLGRHQIISRNLLTVYHLRCQNYRLLPFCQNCIMHLIRWRRTELANNKQSCSTDAVVRAVDNRPSMHADVSHFRKPLSS